MRATPGLDRGRSNHALTPCRPLVQDEIESAIARVRAFAREHGIVTGIQVSPLDLHDRLLARLNELGWERQWPTLVLTGPVRSGWESRPADLRVSPQADREWLTAWSRCEPGRDVEAHARTVLARLRGRAVFARLGDRAVGIGVAHEGLLGMFCLAVAPEYRRQGLGTMIVRVLMAASGSRSDGAYLQVEENNVAALELYRRLDFTEAYRYCHRAQPR